MIKIIKENYDNDLMEIFRAFNVPLNDFDYHIELFSNSCNITIIYGKIYNTLYKLLSDMPDLIIKRQIKRYLKRDLYRILSEFYNKKLPYGSLTGVRPTKLFYDLLSENQDAYKVLIEEFDVSSNKVELITNIIKSQEGIYNTEKEKIDLFINIPFCPSRCSYCSFLSADINKTKNFVFEYTDYLLTDIDKALLLIKDKNYSIRSVYIGGGTPTALPTELFIKVIDKVRFLAPEITVEAGRPDSITILKLKIMKDAGVTRISVNPQSFNDKTLEIIGRNHSVDAVYSVFNEARKIGFDINMDIIAMLPEESLSDFINTVNKTIELNPDNITVHTLSLKRGSKLKNEEFNNLSEQKLAEDMINYAYQHLKMNAYEPYYMYRQKYMSGNLENVGYSRLGKQCIYNIDIMEETHSVIACGAGAISKIIINDRIERAANVKDIKNYIDRFEEIMSRRSDIFNNKF